MCANGYAAAKMRYEQTAILIFFAVLFGIMVGDRPLIKCVKNSAALCSWNTGYLCYHRALVDDNRVDYVCGL